MLTASTALEKRKQFQFFPVYWRDFLPGLQFHLWFLHTTVWQRFPKWTLDHITLLPEFLKFLWAACWNHPNSLVYHDSTLTLHCSLISHHFSILSSIQIILKSFSLSRWAILSYVSATCQDLLPPFKPLPTSFSSFLPVTTYMAQALTCLGNSQPPQLSTLAEFLAQRALFVLVGWQN